MAKSSFLTNRAYIIPILLIIAYFIVIYLDGIKKYIDATKDVSGLPIKRIIKTNSIIVVMIMGLLIMGLILGDFLELDRALYKIGQGILYVFSMIFLVIRTIIRILLFFAGGNETGEHGIENLEFENQAAEYSQKIGDSFEFILRFVLAGLALYLFYKLMVWFIRLIMRRRKISDDIIEKADVSNKKTENYDNVKKSYFRMSKEDTLRRLYRERIWNYRYDIKLNYKKTPLEISDELYDMKIADVEDITKIYRDVRYGGEKVTKEMLRAFKK